MKAIFRDRRKSDKRKSSVIRNRFIKRHDKDIKKSLKDIIESTDIGNISGQDSITIPNKGIKEPTFHHNNDGNRKYILPGNKDKIVGDTIPKPPKGGGGSGNEGSPDGDGEDDFSFILTRSEFLDFFFDDLALPDLIKTNLKEVLTVKYERAGTVTQGLPANLNIIRSMRNAIGRKIALQAPYQEEYDLLLEEIKKGKKEGKEPTISQLRELVRIQKDLDSVPFIDDVDIRYNSFEKRETPTSKAVMFCLMDVSASMGEHEKTLAKKFYMLLHLFLERNYEKVDVVFIRHHHEAYECSEEEFFYSKDSGGTVVSSCLIKMLEITDSRYDASDWNIYVAQASDGDNFASDNDKTLTALTRILGLVQYFAYVQIGRESGYSDYYTFTGTGSGLWSLYRTISDTYKNFVMEQIEDAKHIFPVFKKLFSKNAK